jgi:membrane protein implicated in regulation of membrane protease activity
MTCTFWIVVALIFFAIEILTPGVFFFACLGVGALGGCLATSLSGSEAVAWVSFAVVAIASVFLLRPLAVKYLSKGVKRSNVDALLGQKAWVTAAIEPPALGMVKIDGEIWRAQSHEAIPAETWVLVEKVEGTRLIVKKV